MTSAPDTITKSAIDSNLASSQLVQNHEKIAFSEHSTIVENPPVAERLVKNEFAAVNEEDNINNELDENDRKIVDAIGGHAVGTVIPATSNATNTHSNHTRRTYDIGTVTIQTNMQRNTTISRDQLNLLGVIKSSSSSSSSAMANNNATTQKQHKPDSPMLNYIFDSHLTNKHRHYDPRYVNIYCIQI